MNEFYANNQELLRLINEWEPKLSALSKDIITNRRNGQNRTIKQIVGHMIDSASNNIHRIVHLQYQRAMILDYLRHFKLHLKEIEELINKFYA